MGRSNSRLDRVKWDRKYGFAYYANPRKLDVFNLPSHVQIVIPRDGGFWLIDQRTGVRYRRLTMDDLPSGVTWNTRGKAKGGDDDE